MRLAVERFHDWVEARKRVTARGRPVDWEDLIHLRVALEGAARAMRMTLGADLPRCFATVRAPVVERAWFIAYGEHPPSSETFRKRLRRARNGAFADFAASRPGPA